MSDQPTHSLLEHFANLPDPRSGRGRLHKLIDLVIIAICAAIAGANAWVDVAEFGEVKRAWFEQFLELPWGIPAHDTFGRVFALLDPESFQQCYREWVQDVVALTHGQVIALDGKVVRRSHDRRLGRSAIHMVSAWATSNHVVLGQVKIDDKANEIVALPELLRLLDVSGCIVTIDAIGCQKNLATQIREQGGDYLLAVKDNQPKLHEALQDFFAYAEETNYAHTQYTTHTTVNKGHGRIETRQVWAIDDADYLLGVPDQAKWKVGSLIKVQATRRRGEEVTQETRYYISSLAAKAKRLNAAIRGHWGIENELHWVLDIVFREDESRVRVGHGAQSWAMLRHIALSLLKQEQSRRRGVQGKRLRAGWDEQYLLKVLSGVA